jgi:hypothetical protein
MLPAKGHHRTREVVISPQVSVFERFTVIVGLSERERPVRSGTEAYHTASQTGKICHMRRRKMRLTFGFRSDIV